MFRPAGAGRKPWSCSAWSRSSPPPGSSSPSTSGSTSWARRSTGGSGPRRPSRQERERLRVTLSSIGDAVIATDAEGRVTFMNAVAEALTGWPQAEAAGRPLPEVFRIVNEHTREPVENPALRALREGVDRRAGQPHGPRSPGTGPSGRSTTAPPRSGTAAVRRRGGPGLPRRDRAASGPRRRRRGWPPSSSRPTTPSSARRSTASSGRGTPGPSGCSATPPPRRSGDRSPSSSRRSGWTRSGTSWSGCAAASGSSTSRPCGWRRTAAGSTSP